MGLFDRIFSGGIAEATTAIGGVVDKFVTNDEERMQAKKELTQVVTKFTTDITAAQADVLKVELSGNWLQRSWRPLLMVAFGFIILYQYFISQVFRLPQVDLPERFFDLLEIGLGGYVIGRSVEKVVDSVSGNMDKIPTRKERKWAGRNFY